MDAFWPIVILWVVLTVLGSRKKRQARTPAPAPPPPRTGAEGARGQGGFLDEMKRALEEMQRAAAEEERRRRAAAGGVPAETGSAESWLETRRQEPRGSRPAGSSRPRPPAPQRRQPVVRSRRPLEDDDADKSSEDPTVASLEGRDYDSEAEAIIAERAKAADRGARVDESSGELTSAQVARRANRPAVAIGGAAQHEAWHKSVAAMPAAAPVTVHPPRSKLARWADGSLRSAVVLSEILGRPPGER